MDSYSWIFGTCISMNFFPSDYWVRIVFLLTSITKEYAQHGWLESLDRATSTRSISVPTKIWPWLVSTVYYFLSLLSAHVIVCTHMFPCVLHSECLAITKFSCHILKTLQNPKFTIFYIILNLWSVHMVTLIWVLNIEPNQDKLIQGVNNIVILSDLRSKHSEMGMAYFSQPSEKWTQFPDFTR